MYKNKAKNTTLHNLTLIIITLSFGYLLGHLIVYIGFDQVSRTVKIFSTKFTSIIIEALPFLLIGSFISSLLHVFVPIDTLVKIFPENKFTGTLFAVVAGVFVPLCDCAIIPIAMRLIKKEVPVHIAITFMLAAPIVNPISIMSTLFAFSGKTNIAIIRVLFGIIISISVGFLFSLLVKNKEIINDKNYCSHCTINLNNTVWDKINELFLHTSEEFFNIGKYVITGIFISTIFQMMFDSIGLNNISISNNHALLLMLLFAFCISACSNSDAFIARGLMNSFPFGSIIGFLVFGPMLDLKNILVLNKYFKRHVLIIFTITLVLLTYTIVSIAFF